MNKKITIIFSVLFLTFVAGAFQYLSLLKSEIVNAYQASKPSNGHDWTEMQCTEGLCVTSENKVGIGTDVPAKKLEVNGDILASGSGDICNGAGKCLSSVFQTNVMAGSNPACPTGQSPIAKMVSGTWYDASIGSWTKVMCGQVLSSDGTALLYNSDHSSKNCTDATGTVVSDGTNSFCRINSSSCPSTWTQYGNYSTTSVCTAASYISGYSCSSGSHTWGNVARESVFSWSSPCGGYNAHYCRGSEMWSCSGGAYTADSGGSTCNGVPYYCGASPCYATITQIGCY